MPPYSNIEDMTGDCSFGSTESATNNNHNHHHHSHGKEQSNRLDNDHEDHSSSTSSLSSSSSKKSNKSVSFAPTATVRLTNKIPADQRNVVWFSPEEFSTMKKTFQTTIKLMTNNEILSEQELLESRQPSSSSSEEGSQSVAVPLDMETISLHCIRGLEYRTKDGAKARMRNKLDGVAAVLHEQDRQLYEHQVVDAERLAIVYKETTFHCQIAATHMGQQDQLDIQDYLSFDNYPTYELESPKKSTIKRRRSFGAFTSRGRTKPQLPGPSKSGSEKKLLGVRRMFSDLRRARRDSITAVV